LGDFFLTVGICYYGILSLVSIFYGVDWGTLYRVSGFGILFILNSFWIYIFSSNNTWKKFILVILMISTTAKISYGLRYEIINRKHRFLFRDYRVSVERIINYNLGRWDQVFIYLGEPWQDTNLLYMLKYYDMIYSLPFKVSQYKNDQGDSSSVMLCTSNDLNHFISKKYRFEAISGLDNVYSVIK
jgi:hypothetical protein